MKNVNETATACVRAAGRRRGGFTLAELLVAATLISIVMVAVYTALESALRVSRLGEEQFYAYQEMRNALSMLERETNCILSGTDYLFAGQDDQFEFYAVTQPLDAEESKGPRLLWIEYRFDRTNKKVIRTEAVVEGPLPLTIPGEEPNDREHVKLGRKHKFEFATNIRGFHVAYFWIPEDRQNPDAAPQYVAPIVLEENRKGWGLPAGIRVTIETEIAGAEEKETAFAAQISFQCVTTPYDPGRLGQPRGRTS